MKGVEKDENGYGRGDYVELDPSHTSRPLPTVRIDGPYGAPAEDVFKVEVAVLIGAGIGKLCEASLVRQYLTFLCVKGVTPFASILKHIWYQQRKGQLGSLKRVEFFWVCRDAPSFGWFQSLLQEVEAAQADRQLETHLMFLPISDISFCSQLPAYQHLPYAKDWRGHALEYRCQRCGC